MSEKKLPKDLQAVYDDLVRWLPYTNDTTNLKAFNEARAKAMTDDAARFEILRGLVPADNEGTLQMPSDTNVAKMYSGWPTREEDVAIPTTVSVLKKLGYEDKKDKDGNVSKTAQEKFVEDYLKKPKALAKNLEEKDKGIGSMSSDILKMAFRQSVYDIQDVETQKRREDVLSGDAEDTPWYDKIGATAMKLFTPRELAAYKRGEDPSIGDYASDFGGNALMMVPAAKYASIAKNLATKTPVLKNVLNFAAAKAPKIVKPVSTVSQTAIGNSVAPVGTEVLQYVGDAADSDRKAQFNAEAALLGALTNYGVNDVILRKAGALNQLIMDNQASRAANAQAREALKGAMTPGAVKAKDVLQTYIVNKLGGKTAADYAANRFGIDSKTLKELNKNMEAVDNARYPSKPVNTEGLSDTDIKYINKIIDNPDVITDNDDIDFKMWFATRGNELLRGTQYHVPTLEVKF